VAKTNSFNQMEAKGIAKYIPPLWGAKNRRKWKK